MKKTILLISVLLLFILNISSVYSLENYCGYPFEGQPTYRNHVDFAADIGNGFLEYVDVTKCYVNYLFDFNALNIGLDPGNNDYQILTTSFIGTIDWGSNVITNRVSQLVGTYVADYPSANEVARGVLASYEDYYMFSYIYELLQSKLREYFNDV